jgi:multicomponent Na+:H+ antiporter subunit D
MTLDFLVPLPAILPLFGAGLALAMWRSQKAQFAISVAVLTVVLAASVAMLVTVGDVPMVVDVGGWAVPVGIDVVVDRLSALMLTVSSAVFLCVLLYSMAQGLADGGEDTPVAIYHPTYLVLAAGVSMAFVAGDLFNLFVAFEVLLASSYVLITLGGTGERIRSGTIYIAVALVSSVIFLAGIALVYASTGTVNLAQLAQRIPEIDPGVAQVLQLLLLLAFGIKAAVFPLHAWLPDSYPTAPAPVTAVFAGLLTKVGVYAIIRTQTLLFPGGAADTLLLWLALATMLVGILGAVAQDDVKRLLSFTLVSHIGYMIFGIALSSHAGLTGAIFYVAHHITVQTTLFLVVGLIERRGGTTSLDRLGGLHPRDEPLGHPAALGLPRQARPAAGWRRGRLAPRLGARRRRRRHLAPDALRDREGLEQGLLAGPARAARGSLAPARHGGPDGGPRALRPRTDRVRGAAVRLHRARREHAARPGGVHHGGAARRRARSGRVRRGRRGG